MAKRRKTIQILEGIKKDEGIRIPYYSYYDISLNHVRRYGGSLKALIELSGGERVFLDYLTEVMDSGNIVVHNEKLRNDFLFYMDKIGVDRYSHSHLRNIFMKLVKLNLLIGSGKRGGYYVNPLYFSKSDSSRELLIKRLMEEGILKKDK